MITIITINYNNASGLKTTINSVLEQTYKEVEYIIIDGGSTDGSTAVIKQYSDQLSYWVSEPDNGIYDAMNKGIDRASGSYIVFMNSGDSFYNKEVLTTFLSYEPQEDIVYGNANWIDKTGKSRIKFMPEKLEGLAIFKQGLNHQTIFHHRRIFEKGARYDLSYKILADRVLYVDVILTKKGSYRHLDFVVCNFDLSGLSSNPEYRSLRKEERERLMVKHANYAIPFLISEYKSIEFKYKKLISRRIVKIALKISKLLKPSTHH